MTSKYPVTLRVSWTGDARLHVQPKKYITCQPSIDAFVLSASQAANNIPLSAQLHKTQLNSTQESKPTGTIQNLIFRGWRLDSPAGVKRFCGCLAPDLQGTRTYSLLKKLQVAHSTASGVV